MADVKISDLTAKATAVALTDTFEINESGTSKSVTGQNLVDMVEANADIPVSALANGTDGELITWDAAGAPATVAAGTANQVLTSNGAGSAPTFQASAAGLPRSYLAGLGLANGTDADHDINISAGTCRDAANATDITLAAIVKQIDASWVTGSGNGGLSSSLTVANSTWYHVFAITVGGTDNAGFDTSVTAANLVSDHSATAYRRIGSVLTDGSANIIAFVQHGNSFLWVNPPLDVSNASPSTTANTATLSTPLGIVTRANLNIYCAAFGVYVSALTVTDEAASTTAAPLQTFFDGANANGGTSMATPTNTSSQVRYRMSTGAQIYISTISWEDTRGRED